VAAWMCAAFHLLGLQVRIPPGACMFFSCGCCVLSGRDLCDGLITVQRNPNECVVSEYDCEASIMRMLCPTRDCCAMEKKGKTSEI
jgi:hypothetical protein